MANLIFYDNEHKYTIDGEEVPSVSEITRFMTREVYEEIQQTILDNAASRGTSIHKATEALDKYGSVEIDEDLVGYIQAYMLFLKEHEVEWEKIEWSVHNEKLYAGTLDRYGKVDGLNGIIDIKTTSRISTQHKALYTAGQNLYRKAIEKDGKKVEFLIILQLKKDGTYKLIELEIEDTLADACIALHYALKKKRRKTKDDNCE